MTGDLIYNKAVQREILNLMWEFQASGDRRDYDFCRAFWKQDFEPTFKHKWINGWRPDFCSWSRDYLHGVPIGLDCMCHDIDYLNIKLERTTMSRYAADRRLRDKIYQRLVTCGMSKYYAWWQSRKYFYGVRYGNPIFQRWLKVVLRVKQLWRRLRKLAGQIIGKSH